MSSERRGDLLVTGCYRSGTTLLEKLLHRNPQIIVASQPYPVLWFWAKAQFLRTRGLQRRYPLDHLFREDGYTPSEFARFLDDLRLDGSDIAEIFDELERYTEGLWTPDILRYRDTVQPGSFLEVYRALNDCIADLYPKPDARLVGGKEILCEEYTEYLLGRGGYVVLIVRDPRDMIVSLDYRERDNATGAHRPLLYSLRIWRKSVAIALAFQGHPRFAWLRYEDLVHDPLGQLNAVARTFEVDGLTDDGIDGDLVSQDGTTWKGNSSFRDHSGVSAASLETFREVLPDDVTSYIATVCRPEMRTLGYSLTQPPLDRAALSRVREPRTPLHSRFSADYTYRSDHVDEELHRLQLLARADLTPGEQRRWFLHERTRDALVATDT